ILGRDNYETAKAAPAEWVIGTWARAPEAWEASVTGCPPERVIVPWAPAPGRCGGAGDHRAMVAAPPAVGAPRLASRPDWLASCPG
ncbi:MAG: hypothetical protein M3519_06410, partial [Actinomycetota bacterium]|nr:hypothetical protein [Actinomycetota bacterium]